jgi:hypothetical protein
MSEWGDMSTSFRIICQSEATCLPVVKQQIHFFKRGDNHIRGIKLSDSLPPQFFIINFWWKHFKVCLSHSTKIAQNLSHYHFAGIFIPSGKSYSMCFYFCIEIWDLNKIFDKKVERTIRIICQSEATCLPASG